MTWPMGRETVQELIENGEIERVAVNPTQVARLLDDAKAHLATAALARESDPAGAVQIAYSAYRKAAVAALAQQGLRATTRGGHVAVFDAVKAQFNGRAGSQAFAHPHVFRRQRHDSEYPDFDAPDTSVDDAEAMIEVGNQAVADVLTILDSGGLDRFVG